MPKTKTIECPECGTWYDQSDDGLFGYPECPNCKRNLDTKRKRKHSKDLEAGVIKACLKYLRNHPAVIYVERRTTGLFPSGPNSYVSVGHKGAADIWCLIIRDWKCPDDPFFEHRCIEHIEIECKRADGKGHVSPEQKKFQAFCKEHHIPYFVVTSADELKEKLECLLLDE